MESVGVISTVALAAIAAALAVVCVRSIPDIKRYFKIRHM
jgi:hypothetical protein